MSKLGIKKDLQSSAGIPVSAPYEMKEREPLYPKGFWYPLVRLVNVHYNPTKEVKQPDGSKKETPVLSFTFVEKDNSQKQLTAIFFPVAEDDAKWDLKVGALQQGIKHIYENTVGLSHFKEEDFAGDTFAELFENVAKAFNSVTSPVKGKEGEEAKDVATYKQQVVYLKTVYNGSKLQLPMFPNYVQAAFGSKGQVPCEFGYDPKYDIYKPKEKKAGGTSGLAYQGGTNNSYDDTAFADFEDFPDVPEV